jgi:hypothetical protein
VCSYDVKDLRQATAAQALASPDSPAPSPSSGHSPAKRRSAPGWRAVLGRRVQCRRRVGQLVAVLELVLMGKAFERYVTWPSATRLANIALVSIGGALTAVLASSTWRAAPGSDAG